MCRCPNILFPLPGNSWLPPRGRDAGKAMRGGQWGERDRREATTGKAGKHRRAGGLGAMCQSFCPWVRLQRLISKRMIGKDWKPRWSLQIQKDDQNDQDDRCRHRDTLLQLKQNCHWSKSKTNANDQVQKHTTVQVANFLLLQNLLQILTFEKFCPNSYQWNMLWILCSKLLVCWEKAWDSIKTKSINSSKKVWKYTLCLLCANEQIMQKCENQICFAKSGFWPKVPPK